MPEMFRANKQGGDPMTDDGHKDSKMPKKAKKKKGFKLMPVKSKETPVVKGKVDTRPDSKHAKAKKSSPPPAKGPRPPDSPKEKPLSKSKGKKVKKFALNKSI
jgi:hypothetical protein